MNFAKASSILYPILGENVADIILSYMKPKKRKVITDKPNMYKLFKKYKLKIYKIDHTYNLLKHAYFSNNCNKEFIENRECKIHGDYSWEHRYCLGVLRETLDIIDTPNWMIINDYLYDSILEDMEDNDIDILILEAFVADLKLFEQGNASETN